MIYANANQSDAIFFCRINFLTVRGNLGRGERIDDNFFITNDKNIIRDLAKPNLKVGMGHMEYESFVSAPVVAYARIENALTGREHHDLVEHLILLDTFESIFWLHADCCVGHELGYLSKGANIWSNLYEGIRCRSDASQAELTISADKLRELVRIYRTLLKPSLLRQERNEPGAPASDRAGPIEPRSLPDLTSKTKFEVHRFFSKKNSNRLFRALSFIGRAQKSAFLQERIAFYCSALEALFSTSQQELSHQVAERVAIVANSDRENRYDTYRFVKGCYGLRSKFVHGSSLKLAEELSIFETCKQLDELLRKTLSAVSNDSELVGAIFNDDDPDELILRRLFA